MTITPPKGASGDIVVHHSTLAIRRLWRRKADGSGWWLTDGSGLADEIQAQEWMTWPNPPAEPTEYQQIRLGNR